MLNRRRFLLASFAVGISGAAGAPDPWPQFRGPRARGVAPDDSALPQTWSETENVVWRREVPGLGWSSPVVWGRQVFLTSARSSAAAETVRAGNYLDTATPGDVHRWIVYSINVDSGSILWKTELARGSPHIARHMKNSYATETPVTDGNRVYAHFGHLGTYALNRNGKLAWSRKWPVPKMRFGYGTAASPVLHDGILYIVRDHEGQSALIALEAATGRTIWSTPRSEGSGWATPHVWQNDLRTEIVVSGKDSVRSYNLDGEPLWHVIGSTSLPIPSPISGEGLLFVGSGFRMESFRPLYAIRPGASGDISLKRGETNNKYIAWCKPQSGPYHPTPVLYQGRLYVLMDRGFLVCYDARTGDEVYGKQRIARGAGRFTASPWAYNGKVFCLSEDGDTYVIQAGSEFKVVGKNSLNEMSMATPAIAHDSLFIRTRRTLYRCSLSI